MLRVQVTPCARTGHLCAYEACSANPVTSGRFAWWQDIAHTWLRRFMALPDPHETKKAGQQPGLSE
jgi:hypothetical protein